MHSGLGLSLARGVCDGMNFCCSLLAQGEMIVLDLGAGTFRVGDQRLLERNSFLVFLVL